MVVWLDNWYRKRFGTDPLGNDMSLNVSVLAVLHTTALPNFSGHRSFKLMMDELPLAAQRLVDAFNLIRDGVKVVTEEDMQPEWIRVPLDVQRTGMRSLQWLPYLLTEMTVSSQPELLAILADLEPLRRQTRCVLPLLVDMDIHYRVMKMMYGQSSSLWNFREFLALTPVLYGVCNSFKSKTFIFQRFLKFETQLRLRFSKHRFFEYCHCLLLFHWITI